jgi:DnaK suppressor protein
MKNQIESLKPVLESKRNELVQYIRSLSSQVIVYRMQGMCSRDEAVTLFHALTRTLADVTAALVAIEKGSYGVCVECHEPIALTRLEIIPWAPYCIRCQEVFEYRKQMMSSAAPFREEVA